MDEVRLLILFRGLERLLIELGGILCIALGAYLYRTGVRGNQSLEAKGSSIELK